MGVVVLVEPVAQDAARGLETADLDALGAPAFFAVEDAEAGPADGAVGVGLDRAYGSFG